jgi:hypothetical protein
MQRTQDSARATHPASVKAGTHLSRFVGLKLFIRELGLLGEVEMAEFTFRVGSRTITQAIFAEGIPGYLKNLLGFSPTAQEIQSPEILYGRRVLLEVHQRYGLPTITDIRPP